VGGRRKTTGQSIRHGLVETQARRAREIDAGSPFAEVDEEVGAPGRAREEGGIDLGVVEAGHRAAVQPERPRGEQQIRTLQAAVAQGDGAQVRLGLGVEPATRIGVRKQHRHLFEERHVVGNDGRARRGHRLLVVAFVQGRAQLGLGFLRAHEHEARGAAVGRGGPPLQQVVEAAQRGVVDLPAEAVVGACLAEELVQRCLRQCRLEVVVDGGGRRVVLGHGFVPECAIRAKTRSVECRASTGRDERGTDHLAHGTQHVR
jgi:hypothetical protein